jgi:Na+/proline symporter
MDIETFSVAVAVANWRKRGAKAPAWQPDMLLSVGIIWVVTWLLVCLPVLLAAGCPENAGVAVSNAEDPEKLLDQVVNEMQEDLIKMRQASAQVRVQLTAVSCKRARQHVD